MGKNKDFEIRMSGMQYALGIAKKEGVQALEDELKKRGFFCNADITVTKKQIDEWTEALSHNIYNNMLCAVAWVLNQKYGFGEKRLHDFKGFYNEEMSKVLDYNYMGSKYVSLSDYATELNEKYNLGIDIERTAKCEEEHDKEVKAYLQNEEWIKGVCSKLRYNGFYEASEFLENAM